MTLNSIITKIGRQEEKVSKLSQKLNKVMTTEAEQELIDAKEILYHLEAIGQVLYRKSIR